MRKIETVTVLGFPGSVANIVRLVPDDARGFLLTLDTFSLLWFE